LQFITVRATWDHRQAWSQCKNIAACEKRQRSQSPHRKQNVEYWRARSRVAGEEYARLRQALTLIECAPLGRSGRTDGEIIVAIREIARDALAGLHTPADSQPETLMDWYIARSKPETLVDWYIARSKESPEEPT
jgi:hypothetical protein